MTDDLTYSLAFMGTNREPQTVDPGTFAVVLVFTSSEAPEGEPYTFWTAMDEAGEGSVVDSVGRVFLSSDLATLAGQLAGAGFKRVSLAMDSIEPIEPDLPGKDDVPF